MNWYVLILRIWGDYGQHLLEKMQIVFIVRDHYEFFKRIEVLLRSSGCQNISWEALVSVGRCVIITDDADYQLSNNPIFMVAFSADGIFLCLKHPSLLGRALSELAILIDFSKA